MTKRTWFYIKQTLHNSLSIASFGYAMIAAANWFEREITGWEWKVPLCLLYTLVWTYAQHTAPKKGERNHVLER